MKFTEKWSKKGLKTVISGIKMSGHELIVPRVTNPPVVEKVAPGNSLNLRKFTVFG